MCRLKIRERGSSCRGLRAAGLTVHRSPGQWPCPHSEVKRERLLPVPSGAWQAARARPCWGDRRPHSVGWSSADATAPRHPEVAFGCIPGPRHAVLCLPGVWRDVRSCSLSPGTSVCPVPTLSPAAPQGSCRCVQWAQRRGKLGLRASACSEEPRSVCSYDLLVSRSDFGFSS